MTVYRQSVYIGQSEVLLVIMIDNLIYSMAFVPCMI